MRLGVYGGSFDPPHCGHLILAGDACESLQLDTLLFVPAATQPLKGESFHVASSRQRAEMVKLAIAGDSRFSVDEVEIERGGLSFTVDTLESLSARNTGAELILILGEDALAELPRWKTPERISQLARIAVMRRGDGPLSGDVMVASTRRIDVSSSEIRERVATGRSVRGYLPDAVLKFVESNGLYRNR